MSDCGVMIARTSFGTGMSLSTDIVTFTRVPSTSTESTCPAGSPRTRTCDDGYSDTARGK